jgi:NIMA (never in mitosis gene a)-related kinase
MACLSVPFQGNSIQELYKKITRGTFAKIPTRYSTDLSNMIKLCLTKDQTRRPNVEELLEHSIVLEKMKLYDIKFEQKNNQDDFGLLGGDLMGTIKLPRNLNLLIQKLPKQRYESSRAYSSENTRKKSRSKSHKSKE